MHSFIFDFNGTLFLDTELHYIAWKNYLEERGIPLTYEYYLTSMTGRPNSEAIPGIFGREFTESEIIEIANAKEVIYRSLVASDENLRKLTPGAEEMFDMLKEKGVPFAIATGSAKDNMDFYFEHLNIGRWFTYDNIFYDDGTIPGKPDPAIYKNAMCKMGFDPKETIVVEDGILGIQSAIAAGVEKIIVVDSSIDQSSISGIDQIYAVIHDFHNFQRFI